jgi:glutathione S-transferase
MTSRLKIYQFAHSPFCVAIVQALRAAGIEPELVHVSNADRSAIIRLTGGAYYQVPVLVDGDRIIYESSPDSQDIAAYLDEHYLSGFLFPDRTKGWQTIVNGYLENEVESVTFKVNDAVLIPEIDDVVERTLIVRHKERKFGVGCIDRWARERESLMSRAVSLLLPFEQVLDQGDRFLFGALPVYTDFLLFGILENLTFHKKSELPNELTAITVWRERLAGFRYELPRHR